MTSFAHPTARRLLAALGLACGLLAPAAAEKADRNQPMVVEADKPGSVDLLKQLVVFNGNVVIVQGTMQIRADHVELRKTPEGYQNGIAVAAPGGRATYRQKRDGVDETIEGAADRIEFDGRSEILRFVGNGVVRRMRAGTMVDEITGALITWNNNAELFSVVGGGPTADNPSGRVKAILGPPAGAASSATPAASAASAAAAAPK